MANESKDTPKQQVLLVDFAAQQRQQFLADMDTFRKKPLDRTQPGGYYLNSDGSGAHNAAGDPVKVHPDDKETVEELKRAATFNRAGTGLGQESEDVETTTLRDALSGNISRVSAIPSASDANVRVAAAAAEPKSLDEVAAEIDKRHEALEKLKKEAADEAAELSGDKPATAGKAKPATTAKDK